MKSKTNGRTTTEDRTETAKHLRDKTFGHLFCNLLLFLNVLGLWYGPGHPWKPHLGIEEGVQQHIVGLQVQMEEGRSQTVEEVDAQSYLVG